VKATPSSPSSWSPTPWLAESTADGRHRARHALLADAVATRLLPGERQALHERIAGLLRAGGDALAAEAADHWAAAGRGAEELQARLTAAETAERVFGYAEAAAHWQRALELSQTEGEAAADLPALYLRAIDAPHLAGDTNRASVLAEDAYHRFAGHPDPATAAVVRERAARFRGIGNMFLGGHSAAGSGDPLITEALELFDQAPPSADHAEALFYRAHYLFSGEDRYEEGVRAIRRGLAIAEAAGAAALIPRMQPLLAYHLFYAGQLEEGFAILRRGRALAESAGDGEAGLLIDVYESDALVKTARLQDGAEVARRGLMNARQAGLEAFWTTTILAANGAESLLHQGRTATAAAFLKPLTDGPPTRDNWLAHVYRAEADLLSGDIEAAGGRQHQITAIIGSVGSADWSRERAVRAAGLRLWTGRPDEALHEVSTALAELKSPGQAIFSGPLLSAGMRACADLAERARARQDDDAGNAALAAGAELASLAGRLPADPFSEHPFAATIAAERATWDAGRTRLAGTSDPAAWRAAARAWESLHRPHQAGYAWWRHAEAQLSAGTTRDAAAALQTAATQAAEHAPGPKSASLPSARTSRSRPPRLGLRVRSRQRQATGLPAAKCLSCACSRPVAATLRSVRSCSSALRRPACTSATSCAR
jgi:tetratricopeptide (TPR) repeat protein